GRIEEQISQLEDLKQELVHTMVFYEECSNCEATQLPDACRECDKTEREDLPELVRGLIARIPRESCGGESTAGEISEPS
ncbi:MAG: hypothetical protein P1V97_21200, partial [Planctomycetota bacterium]|nr:hypothetical protein [Planctomycetota bacterium]